MSSLSDAQSDASLTSDTPVTIDKSPIRFFNPAEIGGCLDQVEKWLKRNRKYQVFIQNGVVVLNNGKVAVESVAAVTFQPGVPGAVVDPTVRTIKNPCPPTVERVKLFDANVTKGTPGFGGTKFSAISESDVDSSRFVVNPYTISEEDGKLFACIIKIVGDETLAEELTEQSGGSGRELIRLLHLEAGKATPQDRTLVVGKLQKFIVTPYPGDLTLDGFNKWYTEYDMAARTAPRRMPRRRRTRAISPRPRPCLDPSTSTSKGRSRRRRRATATRSLRLTSTRATPSIATSSSSPTCLAPSLRSGPSSTRP